MGGVLDYGVDWLSLRQKHSLAPRHAREMLLRFDLETGKAIESASGYVHKGSFDDSVVVRSYGGWVEWSGNPARWGKADNLAPISMAQAVQVVNSHMRALGLPEFTAASPENAATYQDGTRAHLDLGAILTRVDLCRTFMTGSPASSGAYLRAVGTATYRGKRAKDYAGEAFSWGKRPNLFMKWYLKGAEIRAHTPRGFEEHKDYRRRLAAWCTENGVVRWEVGFGRNALRRIGMRMLSDWNQVQAEVLAEELREGMKVGATVTLDNTEQAFLDAGFGASRARTASGLVARWYQGQDVWRAFPSRAPGVASQTAYNYRRWILDVVGIDIRSQANIAMLTTRVREVELCALSLPDWYRSAAA